MNKPPNRKGSLKIERLSAKEVNLIHRWLIQENISARECARRLGFSHHSVFIKYLHLTGYTIGKHLVPLRKPMAGQKGDDTS